ncbi:hypothetical protein AXG93_1429s1000 [Marchantia polymorpha subsp. ruderalis]|uniref:Uncharacterized protein n=1 Tax=Marchantia polymorpha subsp. ruderalis TaxID=1480154 RepID=A0A176W304_MARPO|nr:hypothetical protein AXG93_1429s1000 [Marchantia polymorpha subsp. ruderalis]
MKTLFRVLQFKAGNETSGEEPAGYSDLGSTAGTAARRMQENRSGSGLRALRRQQTAINGKADSGGVKAAATSTFGDTEVHIDIRGNTEGSRLEAAGVARQPRKTGRTQHSEVH